LFKNLEDCAARTHLKLESDKTNNQQKGCFIKSKDFYTFKQKNLIMKKLLFLILFFSGFVQAQKNETMLVNDLLNAWHKAASEANYHTYFNLMAEEAVFIGTDANENWNKKDFQAYAKPYFDKGKAWNFTPLERNVYFDKTFKIAWFDELLNTQMKICRGSGVLVKINGQWKIQHYVLSMTIPNENSTEIIKIKTPIEEGIINKIQMR
jgi:hypothetical protein